jgi:hypothetical protein
MGAKEFDPTADLAACQAMAEEFEAYLKSDVLYWQMDAARPGPRSPLGGGDQLPKLTIGGFLERARRLQAALLSPAQQAALDQAIRRFERVRDAQRPRYTTRVLHDLRGRLDAWEWFLDDYIKRPNDEAPYYFARVRIRLAIELLLDELADASQAQELKCRLLALDERLRADWIESAFVWPAALAHAFPRERFWWLYGHLKQPE